ncbi:MAG: LapA family protein [Candidatus Contendobacter sp.]|nr:LapA family protein [Candidatus Contendobacter sp.]MCC9000080.1 LapA family protein [Candidatus Contendobacter sp.]RUQ32275.1 MAG: LapA family protein [Candidatus Competibacteraceae bacterium]
MFWIKFILIAALLSVVLVLGLEFSTLHTQLVTVNYLLGTATLELAWVIVGAFAAGVLISALVGVFVVLPLRWQVARLRQATASKDHEISLLAKKVGREAR